MGKIYRRDNLIAGVKSKKKDDRNRKNVHVSIFGSRRRKKKLFLRE